MKEALIVLSLLGCDDAGAQCEWVATAQTRYETLETCRAASEEFLVANGDAQYPTVAAVCSPGTEMASKPVVPEPPREDLLQREDQLQVAAAEQEKEESLIGRIGSAAAALIPERETVEKPIVFAADGVVKVGNAVIVGVSHAAKAVNPF